MNKILYTILGIIGLVVAFGIFDINTKNIKAAEFTVKKYSNSTKEYIQMTGEIKNGDVWSLNNAIDDLKNKDDIDLWLNSPGGNLAVTLDLNEIIVNNKINTFVGNGKICMSGCAVMWTHGVDRVALNGSKIGFHVGSIYNRDYLKEILEMHGLFGFQTDVQRTFAWFIKYYSELPVKDGKTLALNVALEGFDAEHFYILSPKDVSEIIGGRYIN